MVEQLNLSIADIYLQLFAGKSALIKFESKEQMEGFRIRLHQYKRRQDDSMIQVGMMTEEEVTALSCTFDHVTVTAAFSLKKKEAKKYKVLIIE